MKFAKHHIAGYNPLTQQPVWHEGSYDSCAECRRADEFMAERMGFDPNEKVARSLAHFERLKH